MRAIRPNLPIIALTTVLVLATAIASTTFTGLSHQFMSASGQPIENLYWQLTQVQLEYERAYRLAVEAEADPTDRRQAAALQRYEVFASRIAVVLQGIGMERIGQYPGTLAHIREIEALVADIDRAASAVPDRAAKLTAVVQRLAAANRLMIDYAVAAKNSLNAEEDLHIESERSLQRRLMLLFYGVVAVVLVFAVVAWLQVRRLERSRTELVDLAGQLAERKAFAEHANRTKTNFLANMSHELRTPLNAIIGFAELVSGETLGRIAPPKYADYVRDILKSGRYMLALVGELLDIAKIESGRLTLNPEWLDLRRECVQALRDCDAEARERGVSLEAAEVPAHLFLHADRRAFQRMLASLISNAIRFNNPNGSCVIHAGETDGWLRVGVTDTGTGMPPKLVERLLEPFNQAAEMSVEGTQGAGLGLSLVRRCMELHDGRFEIASIERGGTTVSLLFPPQSTCRAGQPRAAD